MDGGIVETDEYRPVQEVMEEVLAEQGHSISECGVISAEYLQEQSYRAETQRAEAMKEKLAAEKPAPEASISFYVAECAEFPVMVSDQKPDLLPSIVVQSDGKFMTTAFSGFDNATVRKVRELLHHEKFLENGTAERARESGTEQNYNMIDGCVNNGPKKPRVIGGRVSVLDRLHIKQAERARKDNAQVQQQERTRKN